MAGRLRTVFVGATEDYPALDIRYLRRSGIVDAGTLAGISMRLTFGLQLKLSVHVAIDTLKLQFPFATVTYDCGAGSRSQTIYLRMLACRFGGWRFHWTCPIEGRACDLLYLVGGAWASRQAHCLSFGCESDTQEWRTVRRFHRARRRLDVVRGARREKLLSKMGELEAQACGAYDAMAMRLHF